MQLPSNEEMQKYFEDTYGNDYVARLKPIIAKVMYMKDHSETLKNGGSTQEPTEIDSFGLLNTKGVYTIKDLCITDFEPPTRPYKGCLTCKKSEKTLKDGGHAPWCRCKDWATFKPVDIYVYKFIFTDKVGMESKILYFTGSDLEKHAELGGKLKLGAMADITVYYDDLYPTTIDKDSGISYVNVRLNKFDVVYSAPDEYEKEILPDMAPPQKEDVDLAIVKNLNDMIAINHGKLDESLYAQALSLYNCDRKLYDGYFIIKDGVVYIK